MPPSERKSDRGPGARFLALSVGAHAVLLGAGLLVADPPVADRPGAGVPVVLVPRPAEAEPVVQPRVAAARPLPREGGAPLVSARTRRHPPPARRGEGRVRAGDPPTPPSAFRPARELPAPPAPRPLPEPAALAGGELAALTPAPPAEGRDVLPDGLSPDPPVAPGALGGSGSGAPGPPPSAAPGALEAALAGAGLAVDGPGSPWLAEQRREIVRRVQARVNEEPYPGLDALRAWTGVVRVAFVIRRDGRIARVRIAGSSGHAQLDEAALRAVRAASPLPRPPRPQAVELTVVFRLD